MLACGALRLFCFVPALSNSHALVQKIESLTNNTLALDAHVFALLL
jgi:hypothetical protein